MVTNLAPQPRPKKNRTLNSEILPLSSETVATGPPSLTGAEGAPQDGERTALLRAGH